MPDGLNEFDAVIRGQGSGGSGQGPAAPVAASGGTNEFDLALQPAKPPKPAGNISPGDYSVEDYGRLGLNISPQQHRENVTYSHPADVPRMNQGLSSDLAAVAGKLGFRLTVGTAITGHGTYTTTGNVSRHTKGDAVDISEINGVSYRSDPKKWAQLAQQLQDALVHAGYTKNSESGNQAAVLYGFNDPAKGGNHLNHVHISNRGGSLASGGAVSYTPRPLPQAKAAQEDPRLVAAAKRLGVDLGQIRHAIAIGAQSVATTGNTAWPIASAIKGLSAMSGLQPLEVSKALGVTAIDQPAEQEKQIAGEIASRGRSVMTDTLKGANMFFGGAAQAAGGLARGFSETVGGQNAQGDTYAEKAAIARATGQALGLPGSPEEAAAFAALGIGGAALGAVVKLSYKFGVKPLAGIIERALKSRGGTLAADAARLGMKPIEIDQLGRAIFKPQSIVEEAPARSTPVSDFIARGQNEFDQALYNKESPVNATATSRNNPAAQRQTTGVVGPAAAANPAQIAGGDVPQRGFAVGNAEAGRFRAGLESSKAAHPQGAAVDVKPHEFYADSNTKLFMAPDASAGVAVTPDGDLVSVFKHPESKARISPILAEASQHANRLDAFDSGGYLPDLYAKHGFRPVAKIPFDPAVAPPGLKGKPNVVLMVRDPENRLALPQGKWEEIADQVPTMSYEDAVSAQLKAVDDIASGKSTAASAAAPRSRDAVLAEIEQLKAEMGKGSKAMKGKRRGAVNIAPEDFARAAKLGALHLEAGVRGFTEWSAKMLEDLGEWVRPHLKALYDHAVGTTTRGERTILKPGRTITWRGVSRQFTNAADMETYDAIDKASRAAVRAAQKKLGGATTAAEKQRAAAELAGAQHSRSQEFDAFWEQLDADQAQGGAGDLDRAFRRAVLGEEDFVPAGQRAAQGSGDALPGGLAQAYGGKPTKNMPEPKAPTSPTMADSGEDPFAKIAGQAADEGGNTRPGGPSSGPLQVPNRLSSQAPPEGVKKGFGFWAQKLLFNSEVAAEDATKALGKQLGQKVEGSTLDLRSAINTQARIGHKVDDYVFSGIKDEAGNKLSKGVAEILDGMRRDGFDPDLWQAYRRAMRENEVGTSHGIPAMKMAENNGFVQRYLGSVDPAKLSKWDAEWQKLSEAHVDLRERYGLDEPGKAAWIKEHNPYYFPMDKVGTDAEASMRAINPTKLATPGLKVYQASKGGSYIDGFAAMAGKIERDLKAGEANKALLPFFDEAAKHPELDGIAREVTDYSTQLADDAGDDIFYNLVRPLEEGRDAVVTLYEHGVPRTFEVDPQLWSAIRGMQPKEFNAAQKILKGFANVARGLTTKYNPLFAFVFNPMIDVMSATSQHGMNPLRAIKGFYDAARRTGTYQEAVRANTFFESSGVRDFIENQAKWGAKSESQLDQLAQSKGVRVVRSLKDFYDNAARAFEEGTRTGFYEQQRNGYLKKGIPREDAMRRAAQDSADLFNFGEAGELGRTLSSYGTPFSNIWSQAIQSAKRGYKRNPVGYTMRNLALFTAPALAEYAAYKDDPEWQALPDYVKYGGINFRDGLFRGRPHEGDWVSVRIPYEIGVLFKAIPMLGAQYASSDKTAGDQVKKELELLADAYTPSFMPTAVAGGMQAVIYQNSGATTDLRFGSVRSHTIREDASDEDRAKARYKFWKQEADTFMGSMGRLAAGAAGYALGYEKKAPSLLQRYRPVPEVESGGFSGLGPEVQRTLQHYDVSFGGPKLAEGEDPKIFSMYADKVSQAVDKAVGRLSQSDAFKSEKSEAARKMLIQRVIRAVEAEFSKSSYGKERAGFRTQATGKKVADERAAGGK